MVSQGRYIEVRHNFTAFIEFYPLSPADLEGEEWRPIEGCDGYLISNFGRVKSLKNQKAHILKPRLNSRNYMYCLLLSNGICKRKVIHQMVAQTFIPNPDNKPQVNHIYSRFSNHVDCLEWVTGAENMKHAYAAGLQSAIRGGDNVQSKLTNQQAEYIRNNPDTLSGVTLAKKFSVDPKTISRIQMGKTYKTAKGAIRQERLKHPRYINDDIREEIRRLWQQGGYSQRALGRMFGVCHASIRRILK